MSNKKSNIDVLGETHLPEELFPDLGSNYGLDGFPDMEYGLGVLEGFVQGDTAGLPDGMTARDHSKMSEEEFFQEDPAIDAALGIESDDLISGSQPDAAWFATASDGEDGLQLDDMMKESGLNNLDWLEVEDHDADRLPVNSVDLAIPELEEAWGVERRTDGFALQAHNQDLEEIRYRHSVDAPQVHKYSSDDLARVLRRAMRRSAAGHPLKEILVEAAQTLEEDAHRVKKVMAAVKDEHGLAGNVFIRASAYPGLYRGKDWSKLLRKAKLARYIIVDRATLESNTLIQNGYCTVTKKRAVLEVPWKQAYRTYKPLLVGSGRKVAGGDPRKALRTAFRSKAKPLDVPASQRPTHVTPSERVSAEQARREFSATKVKRKVIDRRAELAAQERQQALKKVNAWVDAGLVPRDQAMSVVSEDVEARTMLHRVASLVVRSKGASAFSGLSNDFRPPKATKAEVKAALASWKPPVRVRLSQQHVVDTLTRWVRAGFISRGDAVRIARSSVSPDAKLRVASQVAASPKMSGYSGVVNDPRPSPETDARKVQSNLKKSVASRKAAQARIDEMARNKRAETTRAARKIKNAKALAAQVQKAIDKGVRGAALRDYIRRTIPADQVRLASKYLNPILKSSGALSDTPRSAKAYEGASFSRHQAKAASLAPRPRAKEVAEAVQYAKEAMNEGLAGVELDKVLKSRFPQTVLKAASKKVTNLRKAHEGGAGFVYVDASTYASKTGTTGCEEGGLRHRANKLQFVLAMDRCAGCALAARRADGTSICRTYNKEILAAGDVPSEMALLRQSNIEASSMSEQERTASYFAPTYDPGEFDLSNNPLNGIEFNKEAEADDVDFTFGGMEF